MMVSDIFFLELPFLLAVMAMTIMEMMDGRMEALLLVLMVVEDIQAAMQARPIEHHRQDL